MGRLGLAIIIPAHNEAATIGSIVKSAKSYGTVIVVDDGSTDDTGKIAKSGGAIVITNKTAMGYEGALNKGLYKALECDVEALITLDADGEHNPKYIADYKHILLTKKISVCLGIRPKKQRFSEYVLCGYVRLIHGPEDILCGMKGYRLDALKNIKNLNLGQLVGTHLAIKLIRLKYSFLQHHMKDAVSREDQPRYGNVIGANIAILKALTILIFDDIKFINKKRGLNKIKDAK